MVEGEPTKNLKNFLEFFRGIWELNIGRETWDVDYTHYPQLPQQSRTEHLLIPTVPEKPLVSVRYQFQPPIRKNGAPCEIHTVLSSGSGKVKDLEPVVKVFYLPSLNAEYSGAYDTLTVDTPESSRDYKIYEPDDFFKSYTADDIARQQALPREIAKITQLLT